MLERQVERQLQDAQRIPSEPIEERHTQENVVRNEVEDTQEENRAAHAPDEAEVEIPDGAASFPGQQQQNGHLAAADPEQHDGDVLPAAPARPVTAATRNVGKKKAKSLARKDERRAYHEFMRSQGDAQRAQEREEAAAEEQYLAEERRRRAKVEAKLEEKNRGLREQRKQEERKAWEDDMARRKTAVNLVRESFETLGWANLNEIAEDVGGGVDRAWVEKLCRVEGVIQDREDAVRVVTSTGFVAEVSKVQMRETCERVAAKKGDTKDVPEISWKELAEALDDVVRPQSSLATARTRRAARPKPQVGKPQVGKPQVDKPQLEMQTYDDLSIFNTPDVLCPTP